MQLYIDTASNSFIESEAFPRALLSVSLKRRDVVSVVVSFVTNGEIVPITAGTTAKLGIKALNSYTGSYWAYAGSWTIAANSLSASFSLSLNTVELSDAFVAASEPSSLDAMLEIELTQSGLVTSSNTLPVTINNDVVRGDEGAPVSAGPSYVGLPVTFIVACSTETGSLTTGTKAAFRMPHGMTLSSVRASVYTAPTGVPLLIDINRNGTTILSTKLRIDASEKTSVTAATAAVISNSTLASDDEITIDIDQVGSPTTGAGLKVTLIGSRL